jgi:hypothetical protein
VTAARRRVWAAVLVLLAQAPARPAADDLPDVRITTVPAVVYAAVEGAYVDPAVRDPSALWASQNLTWMFHLTFESHHPRPLRVEEVTAAFTQEGAPLWAQSFSRAYLERLEWVAGIYALTTQYYLEHVMFGRETSASPEVPAGGAVSWVRIPFAQPWFASADKVELRLKVSEPAGRVFTLTHAVPLARHAQRVKLRLPFAGTWLVVKGSDLAPVSHRWTGLNGLTTFGWDFTKLGEDGALYKGSGRTPADRHSYGAPALAPADGRVVHVRNDIDDYGGQPPREVLEKDGDVFSGNLVVLDHGNQEFTLTCHLQKGSVEVKVGEQVQAGQVLGHVGEQGILHLNLMDGGDWLKARGLPGMVTDFERVLPVGPPQRIAQGNPVTGWMVRSTPTGSPSGSSGGRARAR